MIAAEWPRNVSCGSTSVVGRVLHSESETELAFMERHARW